VVLDEDVGDLQIAVDEYGPPRPQRPASDPPIALHHLGGERGVREQPLALPLELRLDLLQRPPGPRRERRLVEPTEGASCRGPRRGRCLRRGAEHAQGRAGYRREGERRRLVPQHLGSRDRGELHRPDLPRGAPGIPVDLQEHPAHAQGRPLAVRDDHLDLVHAAILPARRRDVAGFRGGPTRRVTRAPGYETVPSTKFGMPNSELQQRRRGVLVKHGGRVGTRAAAMAAALVMLLAGCGGAGDQDARDVPVVLTTFTVLQDVAQNVAGEHLRVESITKPGAEIHGYEPTPGDVAKASEADLILDNGLHLEAWFGQFVETADVPHAVVSDGVEALDIAGDAGTPNPHAWMSPEAAQVYVDNMVTAVSELDPEHAEDFAANAEEYSRQLQQIH